MWRQNYGAARQKQWRSAPIGKNLTRIANSLRRGRRCTIINRFSIDWSGYRVPGWGHAAGDFLPDH
jgi:hypothetical protein